VHHSTLASEILDTLAEEDGSVRVAKVNKKNTEIDRRP